MDLEEQKRIVRQQKAGFAMLRRFEIEQMQLATFEDRLVAFRRVMSLSECLPKSDSRTDDDEVTRTWIRIRGKYDAKHG